MQLDREGIDDSRSTGVVDLKEHFLSNGLSNIAYTKLSKDIDNGDMNVDILRKCDENELKMIAKDFGLSYLQQKAFVEAVKLLPDAIANASISIRNHNNDKREFIFVSPKDQNILNEMKQASDKLIKFHSGSKQTKKENGKKMSSLLSQLKLYGDRLKLAIDNIVTNIAKNVKLYLFFFFLF